MCGFRNYRAYDKKAKLMQGIYDITFCVGGVRVSGTGVYMGNGWAERTDPTKRCDVILMQSTSVKDKNGVEIFEGDILSNKMVNPKLGQVIYRKDGFDLKAIKNFRCVYESLAINSCDVVIGNIHENPELLEGAQS